jgi:hypothetical protein
MTMRRGGFVWWCMAVTIAVLAAAVFTAARAGQVSQSASPPHCPALVPGSNNSATDYFDLFVWNDLLYVNVAWLENAPSHGRQLTTVGCSVAELTAENRLNVEDTPWPDRTATFLSSGSPVFVLRGFNHRSRVAVHDGLDWKVYSPMNLHTGLPRPCS